MFTPCTRSVDTSKRWTGFAMKFLLAMFLFHGAAQAAGYDQGQHEVVSQVPVYAQGQQVAIAVLQKGRFHCEAGWARVVLIDIAGHVWIGCWKKDDGKLTAKFEDGDEMTMKVQERGT